MYRRRVERYNPAFYGKTTYKVSTPVGPVVVQPSIYTGVGTSQLPARLMLDFCSHADVIDQRLTALGV